MRFHGLLLLASALTAAAVAPACGGTIRQAGGTSGGSGGISSSDSTSSGAPNTASSSSSTSSGATSSSSSSSSGATSSSSSGAGVCVPACEIDVDCQDTCPPHPGGQSWCCDPSTSQCYITVNSTCPVICVQGAPCNANTVCIPDVSSCAAECTCDSGGHLACTSKSALPVCPSPHPACGDPCTMPHALDCMCTAPGSTTPGPCWCDGASDTWSCTGAVGSCPPLGKVPSGSTCTDFPPGTVCDLGNCTCQATCGTAVWDCPI